MTENYRTWLHSDVIVGRPIRALEKKLTTMCKLMLGELHEVK